LSRSPPRRRILDPGVILALGIRGVQDRKALRAAYFQQKPVNKPRIVVEEGGASLSREFPDLPFDQRV
jgi:hypothetical protein